MGVRLEERGRQEKSAGLNPKPPWGIIIFDLTPFNTEKRLMSRCSSEGNWQEPTLESRQTPPQCSTASRPDVALHQAKRELFKHSESGVWYRRHIDCSHTGP